MNKTNHWTSYDIAYKLFEDMLLNLYISDPRSYEHYRTSSWYKTWKKLTPVFEPMTFAIPVQRSTNWVNKPAGSSLSFWSEIH